MYTAVINGVTIQCETAADAIRLANEVAASNSATQSAQPTQPPRAPMPPETSRQVPLDIIADQAQSKWNETAKTIITLLVQAGADGLDTDRIAEAAGLKGPKGSAPLKKAAIALLAVGNSAIEHSRNSDGKMRWVLTPRARKSAARLGLLPNGEASRP